MIWTEPKHLSFNNASFLSIRWINFGQLNFFLGGAFVRYYSLSQKYIVDEFCLQSALKGIQKVRQFFYVWVIWWNNIHLGDITAILPKEKIPNLRIVHCVLRTHTHTIL